MTMLNELLVEYEALRGPHVPNSPLCGHEDSCPVCDGSGSVSVAAIWIDGLAVELGDEYEIELPCPACSGAPKVYRLEGAARCARRYCGHRESGHGSIALDDADGFRGSEACQAWECDCEGFLEP